MDKYTYSASMLLGLERLTTRPHGVRQLILSASFPKGAWSYGNC
jgi:hypothetical protein